MYSQRTIAGSSTRSAADGTAAEPVEPDILPGARRSGAPEGAGLVRPAHRPVDLPDELAADRRAVGEADRALVAVAAAIGHDRGRRRVAGDLGGVAPAGLAIRAERHALC